jgi:hypothetical protein
LTGAALTGRLRDNALAISTDGRGSSRDNGLGERLRRSAK